MSVGTDGPVVTANLRVPEERTCEACGRHEVVTGAGGGWRVGDEVGDVYCIHRWDITGTFSPVER